MAAFSQKHRTGLATIVFPNRVESATRKERLGNQVRATWLQRRRQLVWEVLGTFLEGEEIETAGDAFPLAFAKPPDS